MRTLVFKNSTNSLRVEYKIDLFTDSDNFTIMQIEGLDDAEIRLGISFKELASDGLGSETEDATLGGLGNFKKFATDNNLTLDLVDMDAGTVTELVAEGTALAVTESDPMPGGTNKEAEVTEVTCGAAGTLSTSGDASYFLMDGAGATNYYVWYNITDGGTEADPAVADRTGIEVQILAADVDTAVATKTQTAIDAETDFGATVATNVVTITQATEGAVNDIVDGTEATGFGFNVTEPGIEAVNYSQQVDTEGGHGTKTFSISAGALPAGLSIIAATGIISGLPTTEEVGTFTVKVVDEFTEEATKELNITIT